MRVLFQAVSVAVMWFCVAFGGVACNGAPEHELGTEQALLAQDGEVAPEPMLTDSVDPEDLAGATASEGAEELIAPNALQENFVRPVKVRDCWYFVSAWLRLQNMRYYLIVRRMATEHCEGKTVYVDYTYYFYSGTPPLVATQGERALVIAFPASQGDKSFARLYNISPETMQNDRLYNNEIRWPYGYLKATRLFFEGNTLVVQGTKSGGPPPRLPYYTAKFEHFLDGFDPPSFISQAELPEGPGAPPEQIVTRFDPPFEGQYIAPFQVNNCWYFISAKQHDRAFIERLPVNNCEGKITPLSDPWEPRPLGLLAVAKGGAGIAIAHVGRTSPYPGPQKIVVQLYNISPETVENVRLSNNQLAMRTGDIFVSKLEFHGNDLVVYGTKTGPMDVSPPESGSGPNYIATFDNFLNSTKPPSVVAY